MELKSLHNDGLNDVRTFLKEKFSMSKWSNFKTSDDLISSLF